ncbi:MAG: hypothetical protein HQ502_03990 [Alphaproteobacteria bacterium]|nr:hypothetical protein [Alphaproteobacteria bacterium]
MDNFGSQAFFYAVGIAMAVICLFALWRTTQRSALASADTADFVIMAPTPMSAALNPDLELGEIAIASETGAEAVQEGFEELVNDLENA